MEKLNIREEFLTQLTNLVERRVAAALQGRPYSQATWNAHAAHQVHLILVMIEGSLEHYDQDPNGYDSAS